jgi:hypothetical protein
MTTAAYRDLIDALSDAFGDYRAAVNHGERLAHAGHVKRCARVLRLASCPRASERDRERAEHWLDATAGRLIADGLHGRHA